MSLKIYLMNFHSTAGRLIITFTLLTWRVGRSNVLRGRVGMFEIAIFRRITDYEELTIRSFTARDRCSFPPVHTAEDPQPRTVGFHWSRSSECRWRASTSGSGSGPCSGRPSSPSPAMPWDGQLCWSSWWTPGTCRPAGPRTTSDQFQFLEFSFPRYFELDWSANL